MGERKDFTAIAWRVQNAAYELATAFHEAEADGVPSRLREVLRTAALKAAHVSARFQVIAQAQEKGEVGRG